MRIAIAAVIAPAQLAELGGLLARGRFNDGRQTAGAAARDVKRNLQLTADAAEYAAASAIVTAALGDNETFQSAALPRAASSLLFSRYEPGMGYGPHVDNALMRSPSLRSDLAFTLFLSPPDAYDGGELVTVDAEGENSVKLPAGALYLYPASTLHRVETVTAGRREVCVGWVQSLVRDPRVREMIFDLSLAKARLVEQSTQRDVYDLIAKTQSNLLRLHAEV
jgi:PKHD-type hydroxylase